MTRILKLTVLVCFVLLTNATFAQSDSTKSTVSSESNHSSMRTLLGKTKINDIGFYVAPELMYGQFNGNFTAGGGGALMVQLNQKWGFGLNVFSFGSRPDDNMPRTPRATFSGVKVEYTLQPNKLFHLSFPLSIGSVGHGMKMGRFDRDKDRFGRPDGGKQILGDRPNDFDPTADRPQALDGIVDFPSRGAFIQPGVNIESNLFRYAKIYAGAKYRAAFNNSGFSNDLSGFSANIGLKLGLFDIPVKKKSKNLN